MKRLLKKAENEFTYIATAPIKFKVRSNSDSYEDNSEGVANFDELKNAVKDSMAEHGSEGLAQYINLKASIYDVVKSIIVDVEKSGSGVVSKTTIKTNTELTNDEIEDLKDYISGQFSDGWGEGFEQTPIAEWTEEVDGEEWDEESQENLPVYYDENFDLCAHFWNNKDFNIEIKKA